MRKLIVAGLLLWAVPGAAQEAEPQTNEQAEMMRSLGGGGLTGGELAKAIAAASAHPLGSKENPVRSDMPRGERAYLDKLRCADGSAPAYGRLGNVGPGVYGYIVDHYQVTCAGQAPVSVYMDMYHSHVESRPIPGFTMAGDPAPPTS